MTRLPLVVALLGLLLAARPGQAASRKLLLAVMDKVNWHDLAAADTPTLDALARRGHIALLVTRTAGGPDGAGSYLTLGAGSRAAAYREGGSLPEGQAFDAGEVVAGVPAGRAYEVQTGWPLARAAVVHLGLGRLMQQNLDPAYPLRLGLLGEELARAGKRVACLGNADTLERRDRDIVALAMDERGRVRLGEVGRGLLRRDASLPCGYTTDPDRLAAAVRAAAQADVLIVELGETSRAAAVAGLLPPARADALRLKSLTRADHLLGAVLREVGDQWAVLVLTPSALPPRRDQPFAPLTPIISTLFPGRPGLLTSPSTRRPGLVTNTDVAATVLSFFGLPVPPDSVGRPITAIASTTDPSPGLYRALARHDALEAGRRQVFRAYATFATAVLWLGALTLFVGGLAPAWTRALVRGLLLGALAAPIAALIVVALPAALSSTLLVAAVVGLSPLLALLASVTSRWQRADAALAGVLGALLAADLLTGQHLLQWSTLSYSASAAARFYGIGNEYAGILLGAALVTAAALAPRRSPARWPRPALAAGLLAVVALLGWPRFGANFGMMLAAAAGLGVFSLYLWRARPSWRDLATIAAAVVVIGAVAVIADLLHRGGTSHVGLLIGAIRAEGWSALTDVIVRKLSMNWLLMRVSQWTDVTVAALGLSAIAAIARPVAVLRAAARWRWLIPACVACFAGAVTSFLLNDSGIVAAGLALCYGAASLAYLGIGEVATEPEDAAAAAGRSEVLSAESCP